MKRFLQGLLIAVFFVTASANAQELIVNGDFSVAKGTPGWTWNSWNNSTTYDFTVGKIVGVLSHATQGGSFMQRIDLTPGHEYLISYDSRWTSIPDPTFEGIGFEIMTNDANKYKLWVGPKNASTSWSTLSETFLYSKDSVYTTVKFSVFRDVMSSAYAYYVDNVSVLDLGMATARLNIATDGEILEGAEDGEIITCHVEVDTLVATLDAANWTVSNLPAGVIVGSINRVDDFTAEITLSGNATEDYDANMDTLSISVAKEEFKAATEEVKNKNAVVFTAVVESIALSDDGNITEDFEDGEEITITLSGDAFTASLNEAIWVFENLPEGVTVNALTRVGDTEAIITLAGNTTEDYDVDIKNFKVTVPASELVHSDTISANTGVVFDANSEGQKVEFWSQDFTAADSTALGTFDPQLKLYNTVGNSTMVLYNTAKIYYGGGSWDHHIRWEGDLPAGYDYEFAADLWAPNGKTFNMLTRNSTAKLNEKKGLTAPDWTTHSIGFNVDTSDVFRKLIIYQYGKTDSFYVDNMVIYQFLPQEAEVNYDGEITEGAEDGEVITVSVLNDEFAATLTASNWLISNLPAGVSVGAVNRINDTAATITLSGNATSDYDEDILNAGLIITRGELVGLTKDFTVDSIVTFSAVVEANTITISDDGTISEGAEDGEVITVSITNDEFVASLTAANWTVNNLPAGVTVGSVNRVDNVTAEIVLSGNATDDYDADISNIEVVVDAAELVTSSSNVSANAGVTFTAIVEPAIITIADDGTITEGAEDGEKITVTVDEDEFVASLSAANWTVNNLPAGVTLGSVNRVDNITAEIVLSGNAIEDYDADVTNVEVVVDAAELATSSSNVSVNSGVTFTATVEPAVITIADDGTINGGSEDGEVITVTLSEDEFVETLTQDNWSVSNLPTGVAIGTVNRVDATTAEITLSGNADANFDEDITDVTVTVAAAELVTSSSDVSANAGVTITANPASSINTIVLDGLNVYPNPMVSDNLNITAKAMIAGVRIFDLTGKLVVSKSEINAHSYEVSTVEFNSGVYMVEITGVAGEKSFVKVIK